MGSPQCAAQELRLGYLCRPGQACWLALCLLPSSLESEETSGNSEPVFPHSLLQFPEGSRQQHLPRVAYHPRA